MRHIFRPIELQRFPKQGDLIRRNSNKNFINVVISVSTPMYIKAFDGMILPYVDVRSVRYGHTNNDNFILLDGQRSRSFRIFESPENESWMYRNSWEIVQEFVVADNFSLIDGIVNKLKDVDIAYRNPDGSCNLRKY